MYVALSWRDLDLTLTSVLVQAREGNGGATSEAHEGALRQG